jgi:hypothetical protein
MIEIINSRGAHYDLADGLEKHNNTKLKEEDAIRSYV